MKSLLFLLFCVCQVYGLIEWPFFNTDAVSTIIFVNVQIGTPPQSVDLQLTQFNICPGLLVDGFPADSNIFYPPQSSTYQKTGDFYDYTKQIAGETGTDDILIKQKKGSDQKLTQMPLNVVTFIDSLCSNTSLLSLAHTDKDYPNNFLDTLLADQPEKWVVFVYDKAPGPSYKVSGNLYFGGQPSSCSKIWRTFPEFSVENDQLWQFQLDKISVAKFAASQPGHVYFNTDAPGFIIPYTIFDQVADQLGLITDELDILNAPANSTVDIVFTINGYDLHIQPQDYMDKTTCSNGYCIFTGSKGFFDGAFSLPGTVFNRYCLLFDFEKKEVGLADKLK